MSVFFRNVYQKCELNSVFLISGIFRNSVFQHVKIFTPGRIPKFARALHLFRVIELLRPCVKERFIHLVVWLMKPTYHCGRIIDLRGTYTFMNQNLQHTAFFNFQRLSDTLKTKKKLKAQWNHLSSSSVNSGPETEIFEGPGVFLTSKGRNGQFLSIWQRGRYNLISSTGGMIFHDLLSKMKKMCLKHNVNVSAST